MFVPQIKKEELSIREVADRWLDYYYDNLPTGLLAQDRRALKLRKVMNYIQELIDNELLKANIEIKASAIRFLHSSNCLHSPTSF